MKVSIVEGDITQVKADALITAISSEGEWRHTLFDVKSDFPDGIDGAIMRCADNQFHLQAHVELEAHEDPVIITAVKQQDHNGLFGDVMFMVDNFTFELGALLSLALSQAVKKGYKTVTVPALRFDALNGDNVTYEKTLEQIASAIHWHNDREPYPSMESVTFVIENNPHLAKRFRAALSEFIDPNPS